MFFRFSLLSVGLCLIVCGALAQVPGDVDGSGIVGYADAEMLIDHLLNVSSLSVAQEERADCNAQAGLDVADLVWILSYEGFPYPEMVSVPAGSFEMGDPWREGSSVERPVHTVSLSAFEIGRFEVTNAEYAAFLNSAFGTGDIVFPGDTVYLSSNGSDPLFDAHPVGSSNSQIEYSDGIFSVRTRDGYSMEDHPVVDVSLYGAAAYCNWLSAQRGHQDVYTESGDWISDLSRNGYHLPTEAQWERAAAWEPGHGHWRYGYTGDTISTSQANYSQTNPLGLSGPPYTSPVGYHSGSTSNAGCHDMSGNVLEWCNDWYSSSYYTISPESDPEGPPPSTFRVLRGGSWYYDTDYCRSASRIGAHPYNRDGNLGFRVSRNP